MSVPASIFRNTQLGIETTRGTPVAANRLLLATSFAFKAEFEGRERFTPLGSAVPTTIQPGVELSAGSIDGILSFTDLAYIFSAFYGSVTPTQIMDGATATGAYRYIWTPAARSWTDPVSLTIETGIAGSQVFRIAGVSISSLQIGIEPQAVNVSGNALGGRMETVAGFTANPTERAAVLPDYTRSAIRVATTPSGLGIAPPLAYAFSGSLNFGDRLARALPIGLAAQYLVPQAHEPELQLTVALNSEGITELNRLRNNETTYVRLTFEGPVIYSGAITVRHALQIDVALMWLAWDIDDAQNIGVTPLTGAILQDATWGKHIEVTLTNNLSAL